MDDKELLNFILSDIYKLTCDLKTSNLAQVHAAVNLLTSANVGFDLFFNQGTTEDPPFFRLTVNVTPTVAITIIFQLAEGGFIL